MVESNAVPGFLPSTNGLHFANNFPSGPDLHIGPIGIGDAARGLCGGMSWYVRERFEAGQPIPPDTAAPANGSELFKALVRRQVQSLDWLRVPFRFWWMAALGPERALRQTRDIEWPGIRTEIDTGRLAMVGLVRQTGRNPLKLTNNHQVLAFAYEINGDAVMLRLYDPNWPSRDDVTITFGIAGASQSTGEPLNGLLDLP
ncbi:MAG: hypothetical protein QOE66_3385 [Chloroflexota bacterium]|jgi:hypothetical protein|nr:hypothetical protein [Chloroflexota bacterium]